MKNRIVPLARMPKSQHTSQTGCTSITFHGWAVRSNNGWMMEGSTTRDELGTGQPRVFATRKSAILARTAWIRGEWNAPEAGRDTVISPKVRDCGGVEVVPVLVTYRIGRLP